MFSEKELFSLDPGVHYLNCAYKAPLLKSAEKACMEALVKDRNPMHYGVDDFFKTTQEIRVEFAKIIHDQPENVALIPSTSYGFASALKNVQGKSGGNAITNFNEFPSGYYSLDRWCKSENQELIIVSQNGDSPTFEHWNNHILDAIDEHTSVVLMSSVHWMNGYKFDLQAIGEKCEKVGATFIVDGTQSVGAMPIDVNTFKIDALVCATYKWLFGPYSMAIVYFGEKFHDGVPVEESWMNRSNAQDFQSLTQYVDSYTPNAGRFNVGEASNFLLSPILLAGLKQINEWKPENIQAYCEFLSHPLFNFLESKGVDVSDRANFCYHLFSLKLPARIDAEAFKQKLAENNVVVSVRGTSTRVAIHKFNDSEDIQQLIRCMEELC